MKNVFLLLVMSVVTTLGAHGQNKIISVLGEAKGNLDPEYAVFLVVITDADCSSRFPDIQSKQRRYAELTKEQGVPSTDNVLVGESTRREENYDGAKDVHTVSYHLTLRKKESMLMTTASLESEIPGTRVSLNSVEFGDNNATREGILKEAYADARHRAEVLAKQSGSTLGAIVGIKEEHFDEGGTVLERIFMADKLYKRDDMAAGYLKLFPEFSITVRLDFELITKP